MPDIFLSYSREDQDRARRFAEALARAGLDVWWDQSLRPGEAFDEVTERALDQAGAVVVLWSKTSVQSRWVRAEATQAAADNRLVPVMIEPCKRPIMFELTHTANLADWKGDEADPRWQGFVADLRARLGRGEPPPTPAPMPSRRRPRLALATAAGLLAVTLVAVLASFGFPGRKEEPAGPAELVRVAVLPYRSLTPGADDAYLSVGLADHLANELIELGLQVIGPEQTARFADDDRDLRELARLLEVSHLISGTFRRDASGWRVTNKLLDGATLTPKLDPKEFIAGPGGLAEIQPQIVRDVAAMMGAVLDAGEYPIREGGTKHEKAFEEFLKARAAWRNGLPWSEQLVHLREAVRLDDGFSRARLTLFITLRNEIIQTYSNLQNFGDTASAMIVIEELRAQRQIEAAKLEQLPEDSRLGRRFRAIRDMELRDWKGMLTAARAAAASAPHGAFDDPYILAHALTVVGRWEEALDPAKRAMEAEPRHGDASSMYRNVLQQTGRERDLRREEQRARENDIAIQEPGQIPDEEQRRSARERWLREQVSPSGGKLMDWPLAGQNPEVFQDPDVLLPALHAALDQQLPESPHSGLRSIAAVAILYGDPALELKRVQHTLRIVPELTAELIQKVWMRPALRTSPYFPQWLEKMGLADYWHDSGKWGDRCHQENHSFVCK